MQTPVQCSPRSTVLAGGGDSSRRHTLLFEIFTVPFLRQNLFLLAALLRCSGTSAG
jgi:hypothetical protein